MEGVILDLNMQFKPTPKIAKNEIKPIEKDFSSTLKAIEERKQNQGHKIHEKKKDTLNHQIKPNGEIKEDEDKENNEDDTMILKEGNKPIIYENLVNLMANNLDLEENHPTIDLEANYIIASVEREDISEEDHINPFFEIARETDIEKSQTIQKDENPNHLINIMDPAEKKNPFIELDNSQLDKKVKDATINYPNVEAESNDEPIDFNSYMSQETDFEETNHTNLEAISQRKSDHQDLNLTRDEELKSSAEEVDIEIDNQPILTPNKDIINVKEDSFDFEKAETIDKKDLIQQIVQKVRFDYQNPKNEIKIKLKPEILGEMTMNIEVAKGAITAKIMVENQRTKEIIEANIIQLKEEIKDTGLEIRTFEVFVGNDGDFDKHNFNHFNFHQNNRRIRIRGSNTKASSSYDENLETSGKVESYSENGLDLLA